MTGENQSAVWQGKKSSARDYVICENRHEPHLMHLVSYVEQEYKITIYENRGYGELYDLKNDSGEHNNLWNEDNCKQLKAQMLYKYLCAEMKKDETLTCNINVDDFTINIDIVSKIATILDKSGQNLWDDNNFTNKKIDILLKLISDRIGSQKMWMPRIAGA